MEDTREELRVREAQWIREAFTKIRLRDILSATNNFSDENIIKESRSGKLYKGRHYINGTLTDIAVWRLDHKYGQDEVDFKTEISMLSSLEHKNISSIFQYFEEAGEKIIIYEHPFCGILNQHLSDPTLTCSRRLQICLGVARALNHIHYDVIHCDIDASKIFLDKDLEPKIFGFELSTKYPQSWRHRLQFDSKSITPKYDVYCYGVLLFDVFCGKKPMIEDGGVKEELYDIIDLNLKKQMDAQSLTQFSKIAGNCLSQLVERPTMDQIVIELEEALELQLKHENLEHLEGAEDGPSSKRLRQKMEFLKIRLSEIRSATNNFDQKNAIGYGGYGTVYKAILDVLDIQCLSSMEGKCKDELPKKSKTVAVKRMFSSDEQNKEGFLTEIELLTSCKHPNIVSLLGFSGEGRELILVYEYAVGGSLSDYLSSTSKKMNLTWSQRIQICLDIAHGINYLHTNMEGKPTIIHRDIKSDNILLDENLKAKVADFGLSKFHPINQQASTIYTKNVAGTEVYLDPEYLATGKYKRESDIYSFGVVLFEILSGRLAYDSMYLIDNHKGLAPIVRRRFNEETLKELLDPQIIKEDDEQFFTLNRGPNQESFDSFSKVAYQCLAETQAKRPTMEAVIKGLQYALKVQGETMVLSRFRLSDMVFATENFAKTYCSGLDLKGMVYVAVLDHFDSRSFLATVGKNNGEPCKRRINVVIKCIPSSGRGKQGFFEEIEMHTSYKHPNIVPLLGFCDEDDYKILVYEHASNGSLDDYLRGTGNMSKHTWTQRLHKCLEIARGLNHLHTVMDLKQGMIHVDIRSANILLGKNWEAKIAYFGISNLLPTNQEGGTHNSIGTKVYQSPEYEKTSEVNKESDIYSFGVVLFEIFCGRLAYDPTYIAENDNGLAPIARRCFNDGTIKQMIDPTLKDETDKDILTSNRVPIQDSLNTFLRIAYQCLAETQAERPPMKKVIDELETALNFQENLLKSLQVSFKHIDLATENFSQKHCVGNGRYWKVYKGKVPRDNANADANGCTTIVAKRWDSKSSQGHENFRTELNLIFKHKHENIVGLVGYCNEMDERIIVYEYPSKGSLDMYLDDASLTWMTRIKICINVASGLEFLHGGAVTLKKVVHRNIQSHAILLHDDWKAKISNLELSSIDSLQDMEHVSNNAYGAFAYLDPEYKQDFLSERSDIYSFGVVLFEILCGRLAWVEGCKDHSQSLGPLAKRQYQEGKIFEMVFDGIKEQIRPESLATFAQIAYECLNDKREERPTARDVVLQLKKALDVQEDYEKWEAELPRDYKEIIQMSETPEIYSTTKRKDLYNILSSGILIHKGKVWFSLGSNGERNEMVSASQFSYDTHCSHKWRSIRESRFHQIAEISNLWNLKIQIKITTQSLSVGVNYGVHLVFRFCGARNSLAKQMYVNLTYKMGNETLKAYFATWREDEWMGIELYRFLNDSEHTELEFLLESFSLSYCESSAIYVEGLECRAIDNEKQNDNNLIEAQQVVNITSNMDPMQHMLTSVPYDICSTLTQTLLKLFGWSNREKYYTLSAKEVLFDSSNAKLFNLRPETQSRFQKVIELLSTQVLRIICKIESERLSPNTEYMCYLVFKLSEKCCGLHCPVLVQDLHQPDNEGSQTVYFRTPHSWNMSGDDNQGPKVREDGWMEVNVWKFKSELNNDCISLNLKLKTYEGTMSGLLVRGLEFRPM